MAAEDALDPPPGVLAVPTGAATALAAPALLAVPLAPLPGAGGVGRIAATPAVREVALLGGPAA